MPEINESHATAKRVNADNDDFVDGILSGDEFHDALQELNTLYGRGDVVSITWGSKECVVGGTLHREGMAVCELQYGMSAHPFLVRATGEKFTVHYRSHQKTVKSDYFYDTFNCTHSQLYQET